jgi:hypothetical protein
VKDNHDIIRDYLLWHVVANHDIIRLHLAILHRGYGMSFVINPRLILIISVFTFDVMVNN